jgi:hypothetical protein
MSGITDHPDDFDREWGLPQGLRAWRRSGRGGASAAFTRSNNAQSRNVTRLRGSVLEGAIPTKNDGAAGIPFEVRSSIKHRPRAIGNACRAMLPELAGAWLSLAVPFLSGLHRSWNGRSG